MVIKTLDVNSNFRTLKEGELIRLVEGGQPVIFKGIIKGTPRKNNSKSDDCAIIVGLDPVDGLFRRRYGLYTEDGALKQGYDSTQIDHESEEGKKYLELIRGK